MRNMSAKQARKTFCTHAMNQRLADQLAFGSFFLTSRHAYVSLKFLVHMSLEVSPGCILRWGLTPARGNTFQIRAREDKGGAFLTYCRESIHTAAERKNPRCIEYGTWSKMTR